MILIEKLMLDALVLCTGILIGTMLSYHIMEMQMAKALMQYRHDEMIKELEANYEKIRRDI